MTKKYEEMDSMIKKENEHIDNSKNNGQSSRSKTKKSVSSPKYKNLSKRLEESQSECNKLKEQLLRKAAEFDNYKKRTEKEFIQLITNANAELLTELLPIIDDLERYIQSTQETEDLNTLHKGVQLIHKNLIKVLEKRGVKPIEAIGKRFDPELHDALMQVDSNDHPSGIIVEEYLKGYAMNDRVLRHSQVVVSK